MALRCLPALAVVPSPDVIKVFLVPADNMPGHKKMSKLLEYFEHMYIWGTWRPGHSEHYGSTIFPIERWNHFETVSEGVARTNSIEGWHYGIQALFQCHHPTWTFMKGLEKDMQMQPTVFLQDVSGLQPLATKRYETLKWWVENAVAWYSFSEILVYLLSIAHLLYK